MRPLRLLPLLSLALLAACASQSSETRQTQADPSPAAQPAPAPAPVPSTPPGTDPHISRSPGFPGAIVVLYPRIVPGTREAELAPVAIGVQQRLADLVTRALPGRKLDIRPAPERACPQAGCVVPAVGAVLASIQTGCSVVVTLAPEGRSDTQLRPWAGEVELRPGTVPFREPPESFVNVKDMAVCADLATAGAARDADIIAALRAAFGP